MSILFNKVKLPLFAPETPAPPASSGMPAGTGKEDLIKFFGEDDDKEPPIDLDDKEKDDKKGGKGKEKEEKEDDDLGEDDDKDENDDELGEDDEDDEDDELSELESELEEPDDEKLELVTPVRRRDILKKYPTLFKDFPYLEKAYYREQQFTEILPTIEDAKMAKDKADTLDKFESDLMDGNTELMLKAAKQSNPKAFNKLVDNYMTVLSKVDKDAYHHVVGNTIRHTIMAMVTEARKSNIDALQSAAQVLNQFVFGSSEFTAPSNLTKETDKPDEKETELDRKQRAFVKQQFDIHHNDLNTRVNNAYRSTIEANMDPKGSMTDYVRRTACRDALENLEVLISKDSRFKILVDKLWEKAASEDFSKPSVDRIRSAFLSKAKTLLKPVIQKARNEALRGIGKRVRSEDKDDDKSSTPKKGQESRQQDKPQSHERRGKSSSKEIPKGMSTLEFLMQED